LSTGRVPTPKPAEIIADLTRNGFEVARQSGSHVVLKYPDGRWTTIPLHKGRDVPKGTLSQIMQQSGLNAEDLTRSLR
jgi:predicted RNA binding protein YcfA (HicA-like mRNA interferase family)